MLEKIIKKKYFISYGMKLTFFFFKMDTIVSITAITSCHNL